MKSIRETEEKVQKPGPKSNKILINKDLLPSKGKYYKTDLYSRKLSAIEMKELSKVTRESVDRVFNSTIASAIDGIELSDVQRNDKLWLIYYLRSITYNDIPMKVQGECKSCGKKEWYDYRLMNLDVVYAEKELEKELVLPKEIKNIYKCKNPRCISSIEQELPQIFVLDEKKEIYRCKYCEEKTRQEL